MHNFEFSKFKNDGYQRRAWKKIYSFEKHQGKEVS